jgi:cell division protein FtsL
VAVWLAACLAVGACVRLQTIEASYVISEQRRLRAQLIEDNRKLDLDLARLSSLDRIEAIASGKLGMRFPSSKEVVKL